MRLVCLLLACLAAWPAQAETARHELAKDKVKPIKRGGETIGARFEVVLKPGGSSRGTPTRVFIGLGRATKEFKRPTGDAYQIVHDKEYGYLRHQFEWTDLAGVTTPLQLQLELKYGEGNDLKPGDKVDLFSVWQVPGNQWHLWGSVFYYADTADVVELPK